MAAFVPHVPKIGDKDPKYSGTYTQQHLQSGHGLVWRDGVVVFRIDPPARPAEDSREFYAAVFRDDEITPDFFNGKVIESSDYRGLCGYARMMLTYINNPDDRQTRYKIYKYTGRENGCHVNVDSDDDDDSDGEGPGAGMFQMKTRIKMGTLYSASPDDSDWQ